MSTYRPVLQNMILQNRFECEEIRDNKDGFCVRISSGTGRVIIVKFEDTIAYRRIYESDALKIINEMGIDVPKNCVFYEVEDSEFSQWIIKQGYEVRTPSEVKHYAIYCANDLIDVLADCTPFVELLEENGYVIRKPWS